MTEPTEQERREINEALARAMWPEAEIVQSLSGLDVRIYDKPNETRSWYGVDFTCPGDASRELVLWLAADEKRFDLFVPQLQQSLGIFEINDAMCWDTGTEIVVNLIEIFRRLLLADPLIIAQAAREAIGGNGDGCR